MIIKRKIIPVIFMAVFSVVIFATAFLCLFLPKQKVSVAENRVLEVKPKLTVSGLFSGEYFEEYEQYFSDTFPLRDELAEKAGKLTELRGKRGKNDVEIFDGNEDVSGTEGQDKYAKEKKKIYEGYFNHNPQLEPLPELQNEPKPGERSDSPDKPDITDNDPGDGNGIQIDDGDNGNYVNNIYVIGNTAFEIFGRNDSAGTEYAKKINAWRAALPSSVNVYNLVVPKHSAFGLPASLSDKNGDQKNAIEHIYEELDEGVTPVRVFDALAAHKNEYLYFRTDHHWTQRGAYYAYCEFIKAAGMSPLPMSSFEKREFEGYLGTLYSSTKSSKLSDTPDTVEAFVPQGNFSMTYYTSSLTECNRKYIIRNKPTSKKNSYGIFIDGDNPLTIIRNNSSNTGRKLLMVKESYGNCFAPFMASHFDEVYVVDQRYYNKLVEAGKFPKMAKLIEQNEITDVLFINNMQAALGGLKNYLGKLM